MKAQHCYKISNSFLILLLVSHSVIAGDLGLSQQALELREGTDPNVVILMDDSGSMDFEVITETADNHFSHSGLQPDGSNTGVGTFNDIFNTSGNVYLNEWNSGTSTLSETTHKCLNATDGFFYGWYFENSTLSKGSSLNNLCATAMFDMWRFRNNDFNSLYYDPDKTYTPWPGLDEAGNVFANIDPVYMPENPYPTTKETVSIDHIYQTAL